MARHVGVKENPADVVPRGFYFEIFNPATCGFKGYSFSTGTKLCGQGDTKRGWSLWSKVNLSKRLRFHWRFTGLKFNVKFIYSTNHANQRQKSLQLTPKELNKSLKWIVQTIQAADFKDELKLFKKGKHLIQKNKTVGLSLFMDGEIFGVGGQLESSMLSYKEKHQAVLRHNDPLVKMFMRMIHDQNKHCGPHLVSSN